MQYFTVYSLDCCHAVKVLLHTSESSNTVVHYRGVASELESSRVRVTAASQSLPFEADSDSRYCLFHLDKNSFLLQSILQMSTGQAAARPGLQAGLWLAAGQARPSSSGPHFRKFCTIGYKSLVAQRKTKCNNTKFTKLGYTQY